MNNMGLILAAAAITYLTRVVGFRFGTQQMRVGTQKALDYIPVAAFAALAIPGVSDGPGDLPARALGAVAAAIVILRFGVLWGGLAAGMLVFSLVRWL